MLRSFVYLLPSSKIPYLEAAGFVETLFALVK